MNIIKAKYEILTNTEGIELLKKIEKIGRTCYKSEDKITNESCINFVKGIITRGHEAMLEHEAISVKFTCDRGVSHELVRHRIASFAQESTRYCNYSKDKFGKGITYINLEQGINNDLAMQEALNKGTLTSKTLFLILNEWVSACKDAEKHYLKMIELGASPNIARSVLNNSTKTEVNVTMNIRNWRHFFSLRVSKAAHPQMRELTIPLLNDFRNRFLVLFDDINIQE